MKSVRRRFVCFLLVLVFLRQVPLPCVGRSAIQQVAFAAKGFGGSPNPKSKRKKKSAAAGGGPSPAAASVHLSKEAKILLKKHGNNVDNASSEYFQSQMEEIAQASTTASLEDQHEARVAATWNTVALFLPQEYKRGKGKVEGYVERRLRHIATACRAGETGGEADSVVGGNAFDVVELLDVGCGDGAIVPYLSKECCSYNGCDVSAGMIDLGKRRYPQANLWVGGFPKSVPTGAMYDAILFNGSLQFFRDTRLVLEQACQFLKPGGRIVLTHVNGSKFVKDECLKNPQVAVRNMPNNISLLTMAELLGLTIVEKSVILGVEFDVKQDGDNEKFYLVVLEKSKDM